MKIAVTAKGPSLDDQVDPRFGRCPYFVVIDTETMEVDAIENPNLSLGGGAGIQSAQLMAERDVQGLLTGNCGPNAYRTLEAAGIDVIIGVSGRIGDVVEHFKTGALRATDGPNVASHFGMGSAGGIRGGVGMGRGMGIGRGMGMGRGRGTGSGTPESPPLSHGTDEIESLKAHAEMLEKQLRELSERITQAYGFGGQSQTAPSRMVAAVNPERCTACGRCVAVCPTGAITVDAAAVIAPERCTGCGECLPECPQEAITLRRR